MKKELKLFTELTAKQLAQKQQFVAALERFIPAAAVEYCAELIIYYNLHLHIEKERKTKYGDYSPHDGKGNRISINYNLSKFDFLVTFIHELSHHTAYLKYGSNHDPHGAEWKKEFQKNMIPFFEADDIFPYDLKAALAKHMRNPKYTHSSDVNLLQALKKYDGRKVNIKVLADIPVGSFFKMKGHPDILKKLEKLRTYVLCESSNGKKYRVHAMVEVTTIEN